jgi:hypothetical protein
MGKSFDYGDDNKPKKNKKTKTHDRVRCWNDNELKSRTYPVHSRPRCR